MFELMNRLFGVINNGLQAFVTGFIHIFKVGGENFAGLVIALIPMLIVMLTFFNTIIGLIGEERVNGFAKRISRFMIFRYTLLPVLAILTLTSPMCFSMGRFLEEKYKPAFYDATVSFVHPVLGMFPYANTTEYFVYFGIATGVEQRGFLLTDLVIRYFLVGLIVIFLRGVITEKFTGILLKRKQNVQGVDA